MRAAAAAAVPSLGSCCARAAAVAETPGAGSCCARTAAILGSETGGCLALVAAEMPGLGSSCLRAAAAAARSVASTLGPEENAAACGHLPAAAEQPGYNAVEEVQPVERGDVHAPCV